MCSYLNTEVSLEGYIGLSSEFCNKVISDVSSKVCDRTAICDGAPILATELEVTGGWQSPDLAGVK